jgi:hypothetical protein
MKRGGMAPLKIMNLIIELKNKIKNTDKYPPVYDVLVRTYYENGKFSRKQDTRGRKQ